MKFPTPCQVFVLVGCVFFSLQFMPSFAAKNNKLLLFLLDGFRWDYIDVFLKQKENSGFRKLQKNGVRAQRLIPDFPSLSYVNYYSIITGLHAGSHGIIHNYMYDPTTGKKFLIGENDDQYDPIWWNDGEPLWVTAEKQSKRSYFWYWCGCEVKIRGVRPQFCQPYQSTPNPSFDNFTRAIDSAIQVLRNGSADVAGIYLEQVDHWGHKSGPDSANVATAVRRIDDELYRLLSILETPSANGQGKLADSVNIMVFADHGMTRIIDPNSGVIDLRSDLFFASDVVIGSKVGPIVQVYTSEENVEPLYTRLRSVHPNVTVYRKRDIPERYFLKNHKRVPPLLLVADSGYAIRYQANITNDNLGFHGYDNRNADMHGIFFAMGPDFQEGKEVSSLRVVDLYQVMCHVLKINPAPNNGSWSEVTSILKSDTGNRASLNFSSTLPLQLLLLLNKIISKFI